VIETIFESCYFHTYRPNIAKKNDLLPHNTTSTNKPTNPRRTHTHIKHTTYKYQHSTAKQSINPRPLVAVSSHHYRQLHRIHTTYTLSYHRFDRSIDRSKHENINDVTVNVDDDFLYLFVRFREPTYEQVRSRGDVLFTPCYIYHNDEFINQRQTTTTTMMTTTTTTTYLTINHPTSDL
jgi:hypothetical protein